MPAFVILFHLFPPYARLYISVKFAETYIFMHSTYESERERWQLCRDQGFHSGGRDHQGWCGSGTTTRSCLETRTEKVSETSSLTSYGSATVQNRPLTWRPPTALQIHHLSALVAYRLLLLSTQQHLVKRLIMDVVVVDSRAFSRSTTSPLKSNPNLKELIIFPAVEMCSAAVIIL